MSRFPRKKHYVALGDAIQKTFPSVEVEHADSCGILCGVAFHTPTHSVYVADADDTALEKLSDVPGWSVAVERNEPHATDHESHGHSSESAAALTADLLAGLLQTA